MVDRPIIFSGPMVRALLDGRKSMTRRVLKPQPGDLDKPGQFDDGEWYVTDSQGGHMTTLAVPYAIGDRLWVREAWRSTFLPGGVEAIEWRADQAWLPYDRFVARLPDYLPDIWRRPSLNRWRPSIHMPRWASRLTLVVTDVRVQRVQDISEVDVAFEGIRADMPAAASLGRPTMTPITWNDGQDYTAHAAFRRVWDSLNAKRGYGWDANPWVVALTFETHRCNIDEMKGEA